eukprot:5152412-Prymnesium_polylepis.1
MGSARTRWRVARGAQASCPWHLALEHWHPEHGWHTATGRDSRGGALVSRGRPVCEPSLCARAHCARRAAI